MPNGILRLRICFARLCSVSDIDRLSIHLPAMAHWTCGQREALAAQTCVFDVEPGTAIVRQGDRTNMEYFLLSGRTVATRSADGPVLRTMWLDPKIKRVLLAGMNERLSLLNLIASPGVTGMAKRS